MPACRIEDNSALAQEQWERTCALAAQCGLQFSVGEKIPDRWLSRVLDDVGYSPGRKAIFLTPHNEILCHAMHEVCHWLVASPAERRRINWGFEAPPYTGQDRETDACLVTVGIAKLWGYEWEATRLHKQLNPDDGECPDVAGCAEFARQVLQKNGVEL